VIRRRIGALTRHRPVASVSHVGLHTPKSPADGWANSGSAAAICLLIAMAPVSGGQHGPWMYPGEARIRANTGRATPNPFVDGLLTGPRAAAGPE
jgi:hypothetical protein